MNGESDLSLSCQPLLLPCFSLLQRLGHLTAQLTLTGRHLLLLRGGANLLLGPSLLHLTYSLTGNTEALPASFRPLSRLGSTPLRFLQQLLNVVGFGRTEGIHQVRSKESAKNDTLTLNLVLEPADKERLYSLSLKKIRPLP